MAHIIAARIGEATVTEGPGVYIVTGAFLGHRAFSEFCQANDYFYGFVEAVDADGFPTGAWEEGLYTYASANTINRTQIHASSNANAAVNWGPGTKRIRIALTSQLMRSLVPGSIGDNVLPPGDPPPDTPPPSGIRPGYNPSAYGAIDFNEDFNGNDIDRSKWNTTIWYEGEPAIKNYDVNAGGNSCLRIWPALGPDGRYFNRTLDTDGKVYHTYGYYEARMKLNTGFGTWPAFWVFNHIGAERPELDIMEAYVGGERNGNGGWSTLNDEPISYSATMHADEGQFLYTVNSAGQFGERRLDQEWFKVGMHWDATGVQFTFNDQPLGVRFESPYFTRPMYMMLDLWYGSASGDPNNPPGGTGFAITGPSNSYMVDYVRHWPLGTGGGGTPPPDPVPGNFTNADFWGDSTVRGYVSGSGAQAPVSMPQAFAAHFPETFVRNMGVDQVDSKNMLEGSGPMEPYGGWADNMVLSNATHVFIQVGINDAANAHPKIDYQYWLGEMITEAQARNKKVIILSSNPTSTMDLGQYRTWAKEIAQTKGAYFIDVYQFCLDYMSVNGVGITTICPDGIHPSNSMYVNIGDWVAAQWQAILDA